MQCYEISTNIFCHRARLGKPVSGAKFYRLEDVSGTNECFRQKLYWILQESCIERGNVSKALSKFFYYEEAFGISNTMGCCECFGEVWEMAEITLELWSCLVLRIFYFDIYIFAIGSC